MKHHSTSPCSEYNYTGVLAPSQERREAWAEFLNQWDWDWFVTLTFREKPPKEPGFVVVSKAPERDGKRLPLKIRLVHPSHLITTPRQFRSVHPEAANKLFHLWVSKINRELYGPRWSKHGQGVNWVRASEYQRRGMLHYHALLGGASLGELRRLKYMDIWADLAGWSKVESPRSFESVVAYVSKYVVKGGEIDLGGPLKRDGLPLLKFGQVVATPEPNGANQA